MTVVLRMRIQKWFTECVCPVLEPYQYRKLNTFSIAFVLAGCLLAYGFLLLRLAVVVSACILIVLTLIGFRHNRMWYKILLPSIAGLLCSALLSAGLFDFYVAGFSAAMDKGDVWSVEAVVSETVYENSWSGQYICQVKRENGPTCRVLVSTDSAEWTAGDVLRGEIILRPWEEVDDGFEESSYYLGKGVLAAADDVTLKTTGERRFSLRRIFQEWNVSLSARIEAHVQKNGLAAAMLLGNRDGLEDSVKRDFRRLGIYHLLAVSGTHITLLTTVTEQILIRMRVRPGKRMPLMAAFVIFYMALTGFSSSVMRAGLMHLLAIVCQAAQMKVRYFQSLNIACLLILLVDPFAVLDMGLHLSYIAFCGCLITMEIERKWPAYRRLFQHCRKKKNDIPLNGLRRMFSPAGLLKKALSMMLLNLVISCLTMTLSWLYFGEISLVCLLVNLLYLPATGLVLFLTLVYLVLYPITFIMLPLAETLSLVCGLLEWSAAQIARFPKITISLAYPFVPLFLVPLAVSVCALPWMRNKGKGILLSLTVYAGLLGCVGLYEYSMRTETVAIYRSDGNRDGILLRSGGQVLLLDISDGSYSFTRQLLSETKAVYATELEGYMLTHYHNRHISTFTKLTDNWILRRLYLPEPVTEAEREICTALVQKAEERKISVDIFPKDTVFALTEIRQAQRVYLSRSTHPITGFSLTAGTKCLTYGSSSFTEGDPTIVDRMEMADAVIFGSHSPVTKKPFDILFVRMPKVLVYGGDSETYSRIPSPAGLVELYNPMRVIYRFGEE